MGKREKGRHGSLLALPALAPAALDIWEPGRLLWGGRGACAPRGEVLRFTETMVCGAEGRSSPLDRDDAQLRRDRALELFRSSFTESAKAFVRYMKKLRGVIGDGGAAAPAKAEQIHRDARLPAHDTDRSFPRP